MHTTVSHGRGGFSRTFSVVDFLDHVQSQKRSDHARSASEGQSPYQYGDAAVNTPQLEGRDPADVYTVGMAADATGGSGHHSPAGYISRWIIRGDFRELVDDYGVLRLRRYGCAIFWFISPAHRAHP